MVKRETMSAQWNIYWPRHLPDDSEVSGDFISGLVYFLHSTSLKMANKTVGVLGESGSRLLRLLALKH